MFNLEVINENNKKYIRINLIDEEIKNVDLIQFNNLDLDIFHILLKYDPYFSLGNYVYF